MRKISDNKELMKLCSFIVMGDGSLYKNKKCNNYKFIMNMKAEHLDYIEYCKDILDNISSAKIYNRKEQLTIVSKTHPFLTKIHDRIYIDNYKGLDPHAFKLFDWECLAILFMCDGCLTIKKGYVDVTLNLKRLSYGDQLFLKKALKDKMNLEWNINRQNKYYYLRLRSKDINSFYNRIKPYILPSFSYKILNVEPH